MVCWTLKFLQTAIFYNHILKMTLPKQLSLLWQSLEQSMEGADIIFWTSLYSIFASNFFETTQFLCGVVTFIIGPKLKFLSISVQLFSSYCYELFVRNQLKSTHTFHIHIPLHSEGWNRPSNFLFNSYKFYYFPKWSLEHYLQYEHYHAII